MINVVIVDDEPLAQEILKQYLGKIGTFEIAGVCKNALEAFALLNRQKIDILLLDIDIPEINGIDFIKSLKNPPLVIFTTAYSNYAVESYELNAVDYLLKPISFDRFLRAINKAQLLLQPSAKPSVPAENNTGMEKILFVRSDGKWVKVDLTKIWFVEGVKDYIKVWTDTGRVVIHSTMKNFEEQLSPFTNFIRVHKSYIVNLEYIQEIESNSIKIKDQIIAIGTTYREEVHKRIDGYKMA
jgi:DNA-binding LytR/AlgR family response regulator